MTPPTFISADYNGDRVYATWKPSPDLSVTGYRISVTGPGTNYNQLVSGRTSSSGSVATFGGPLVPGCSVQVCAENGMGESSCALPVPLLISLPELLSFNCTPQFVEIGWKLPANLAGISGYTATLTPSGGASAIATTADSPFTTEFTIPLQAPLANLPWDLVISGNSNYGVSASTRAEPFNASTPALTHLNYDGRSLTVDWSGPANPQRPVIGYEISIYSTDGGAAITTAAGGSPATIPLAVPLDPAKTYSVSVEARINARTGSSTAPARLLIQLPELQRVDYDSTRLAAAWNPPLYPMPAVTSYQMRAVPDSGPPITLDIQNPYAASGQISQPPFAAGQLYRFQVCAIGANLAACSAPEPILTQVPAITTALYDGASVRLTWTPVANPLTPVLGYRATVSSSNGGASFIVAVANPAAAQAVVDLDNDFIAGWPYSVVVSAICAGTATASTPALALNVAQPGLSSANYTGSTVIASWTAPGSGPAISAYVIHVFSRNGGPTFDSAPISPSELSGSVAIPNGLDPNGDYAIQIVAQSGSIVRSASVPAALIMMQPTIRSVDFDGATAVVEWEAASGVATATGYRISVLASDGTQPVFGISVAAPASRASFQPNLGDLSKTYQIIVQAEVSKLTGLPSARVDLFQPGLFVSTKPAAQLAPYINPSLGLQIANPYDVVAYLPELAQTGSLKGLPISVPAAKPSFKIEANTGAGKDKFPYKLTIPAAGAAWQFTASPVRAQLQKDYQDFLKALDPASGISTGGTLVLQQVISRAMPQTFQETLLYAYGLDLTGAFADLRPGLVLRCAFGEFMNAGTGASKWLIGYVGGAVVDYDVSTYVGALDKTLVGFDAFIAQLVAAGAMAVNPPDSLPTSKTEAGVADAADLFYPSFRNAFYRIFFPSPLVSSTGVGEIYPARNFAIASAASYAALLNTVNYPTGSNAVAYFRGRAVLKLCIRVFINGIEEVVPLGTTVGNVLERWGWRPPVAPVAISGLTLRRSLGPAVFDQAAPYSTSQSFPVRLAWSTLPIYGTGRDSLSLPLLHGDQITIRPGRE